MQLWKRSILRARSSGATLPAKRFEIDANAALSTILGDDDATPPNSGKWAPQILPREMADGRVDGCSAGDIGQGSGPGRSFFGNSSNHYASRPAELDRSVRCCASEISASSGAVADFQKEFSDVGTEGRCVSTGLPRATHRYVVGKQA